VTESDKTLILKKYPLWAALSEEEYHDLQVLDNFKEVKEGAFIYFEAFQHNKIYFIKSGYIRLGYLDEVGNRAIKDILQPGDFFGQISLEKENLNGEFAQAMRSDVSLCSFTVEKFDALLRKKPQLAVTYSKWIGVRLRRFENRLLNLLQKDAKTRLIHFLEQLLKEAKTRKESGPDEVRIPNYLIHEEIAQLIGTSRQTVTTLFNELKEDGICVYGRKELKLFRSRLKSGSGG
jgi:CRP/FNR family transcriptional regulator